ncbi:hypothetical protein HDU97_006765 [Phlyctochytrium planicorne]|nr:hypothetical protein HDU97_006765 [Phlyctochytrium planicorne]
MLFATCLILVFAILSTVQAKTYQYDIHVDTVKMPFCLHNINANRQDYTAQDFIRTIENLCGSAGSSCAGKSSIILADYTMDGDRVTVDAADYYGDDRRGMLVGALAGAIIEHVNKNDRTDCWNADDDWDTQIIPKAFHAFAYDCNDSGKDCFSASNLRVSFQAGWVRKNPDWCSLATGGVDVAVKALKLEEKVFPQTKDVLVGIDFFNTFLKMLCGFGGRGGLVKTDCEQFNHREVERNEIPYECKAEQNKMLIILLLATLTAVSQARIQRYDVHADTEKMAFCLHTANSDRDYVTREYVAAIPNVCSDLGSNCVGKNGPIQGDNNQRGDGFHIDYADFWGNDRRDQLVGVISGAIQVHTDKNDRMLCPSGEGNWDSQSIPKTYHAFVYDCDDNGSNCNSAANMKISFYAGWIPWTNNFCSIPGAVDVGIKGLKLEDIVPVVSKGALAAFDFFNAIFKLICGLANGKLASRDDVDCTAFHHRQVELASIPYECKAHLLNVTLV